MGLEKTLRAYEDFKHDLDLRCNPFDDSIEQEVLIYQFQEQEYEKLNEVFESEYNEYIKKGKYFYGCPIEIYSNTYHIRLKEYDSEGKDELAFLIDEIDLGIDKNIYPFLENGFQRTVETSLRKRKRFIEDRLKALGYSLTRTPEGFEVIDTKEIPKDKSYPDYCLIGALFAQGLIRKQNIIETGNYKYFYEDLEFKDLKTFCDYLQTNILKKEIKIRQYVSDTLSESGIKNFYKSAIMMKNIIDYCNHNNITLTEEFKSKYEALET